MTDTAILVEKLGKRYRIGGDAGSYGTLRDRLASAAGNSVRALRSATKRLNGGAPRGRGDDTFWALRDVSFEIKRGEVVGIIGPNGAGKSTLLKVLSRITEPTEGTADIHGRIGSLLEVGTGFHHELSGRDNIFLNGAILGMRRAEIASKFDEIVEFAEVERFIDTPVKHYSSGMYLRLAFAVAAHLEPEVLLVDEVLAVGDVAFQKKCLGKMDEVAKHGRTVLFVSHNMSAVKELCQKGILLDRGSIAYAGGATQCIAEYFTRLESEPALLGRNNSALALGRIHVEGDHGSAVSSGQPFKVTLTFVGEKLHNPSIFFMIEDFSGRQIVHSKVNSRELDDELVDGERKLELEVPPLWLSPGLYALQFKFILSSVSESKDVYGPSTGRLTSEKFMLEVHGEPEMTGRAALNPKIGWKMTDGVAELEASGVG